MENTTAPLTLEEQADAILRQFAMAEGKSFRMLGLVDERRARTVYRRELTMSAVVPRSAYVSRIVTGEWVGDVN
jgi:hypothetical protein